MSLPLPAIAVRDDQHCDCGKLPMTVLSLCERTVARTSDAISAQWELMERWKKH